MKRERSCTSSIPAESFLAKGKRNGIGEINESAISLRRRKYRKSRTCEINYGK